MGKIIISENVSLDGVVQDPTGEEGFRLGGWFGQFGGKDLDEWERLFGETSDKKPMRLISIQTVGDGLALLTYERVPDA